MPLQAIVPRELPGEDKGKSEPGNTNAAAKKKEVEGVFVFERDGKAHFKQVTTGIKGDQDIEVTSGISEGDEIVTGPYKTLRALKDLDPIKKEVKPAAPESK